MSSPASARCSVVLGVGELDGDLDVERRPRSVASSATRPASRTSASRARSSAARRSARVAHRRPRSTSARIERCCVGLRLADLAEHLGRDAGTRSGRRRRPRPRIGAGVGHALRCTEPSCHHDQTSSVTNGRTGANRRSSMSSASAERAPCRARRRVVAVVAVGALLDQLEVVVAEAPEEPLGALERARVVVRRRTPSVASATTSASAASIDAVERRRSSRRASAPRRPTRRARTSTR